MAAERAARALRATVVRCWAGAVLTALALAGGRAQAQEDEAEDHGSRAAAKVAGAAHARRKVKSLFTPGYHAGAFGGSFVQGQTFGTLLNAGLNGTFNWTGDRLRGALEYQYDPFTTKTFNFPEEDQTARESRLAQSLHEIDARTEWQRRWSDWLRSSLSTAGDLWLPDVSEDRRWSLRSEAEVRLGKARGPYAESSLAGFLKKYPDYYVADRRIDQLGGVVSLEAGYAWATFTSAALGADVELSHYLDARYDQLEADGNVSRAPQSKSYLSTQPYARVAVSPVRPLRLGLKYSHEFNDSSHYSRRMPGQDALGNPVVKFIPDYYDYARDRLDFKAKLSLGKTFSVSALAEGWLRGFDTYEARDANNVWTGELRHDQSLELGTEVSVYLLDVDTFGVANGVYVTGFGSHVIRRSNMQREVSLATNFDVTRMFVGLELRPR